MADDLNVLGEYLHARRELVSPDAVGIPVLSTRRVVGLRREEVAMLAGISAEYYLRLEQGRDRNPSAQVLRSIVLQLEQRAVARSPRERLVHLWEGQVGQGSRRRRVPAGPTLGVPPQLRKGNGQCWGDPRSPTSRDIDCW